MKLRGEGLFFFFSSRRRHTRCGRDWSSDVCFPIFLEIVGVRGVDSDLEDEQGRRDREDPIAEGLEPCRPTLRHLLRKVDVCGGRCPRCSVRSSSCWRSSPPCSPAIGRTRSGTACSPSLSRWALGACCAP